MQIYPLSIRPFIHPRHICIIRAYLDTFEQRSSRTRKQHYTAVLIGGEYKPGGKSTFWWNKTELLVWICMKKRLKSYRHLDDTTGAVWRHLQIFFSCFFMSEESLTSYFICIRFSSNELYLWNSRSVLWTQTLHPTLHWQSGELMMSEISFFGELSLSKVTFKGLNVK